MRADLDPKTLLEQLRDLPPGDAPYGYSEFSYRHARRRLRQAQRPVRLLAAAVAVVIAGWVVKHGLAPVIGAMSTVADAPLPHSLPPGFGPAPAPAGARPVLLPTVNAERWLEAHPQRGLVRVPAQMAVTELEDQIATMDDQLNAVRIAQPHAQQLAMLQRDRAQLVESLAQVRYAQNLVAGLP
ncbi:MAG TPA: hypothetical protein VIY90_02295 [Steroidobacteraceae bacterium]